MTLSLPPPPAAGTTPVTPPLSAADLVTAVHAGGPGKHLRTRLILGAIVVVLLGGGWWWWHHAQAVKNAAPAFVTEPLARGNVRLVITATGNLEPTTQVTIGSELSGTTLEVYVDINDRVIKGQPLAKLDTSKLAQQTASSRAAVKSAQAQVAQAQATVLESAATVARLQELSRLSAGQLPSPADLATAVASADRASANLLSAQAAVGEVEAQVSINENDLAKAVIKSPIDGIVLTRSIEPGQTVAASFTAPELFVIAEKLERMDLKIAIAEADIGRVTTAQTATFTVDAWPDRSYSANVSTVAFGSAVTNNVVTYEATLAVANDDLSLRPGMTATADIVVAESKNVFRVPAAALRFTPAAATTATADTGKSFVQSLIPMPTRNANRPAATDTATATAAQHLWILRDGSPVSVPVTVGLTDGGHTEVSGPELSEGLAIILRARTATP